MRKPVSFFNYIFLSMLACATLASADEDGSHVASGYLPRDAYVAPPYVPPPPPEPKVHMQDNGDGTLTDDQGLMWTRRDSYAELDQCLNWYQSDAYVARLNKNRFAGYADWRLPSLIELVGIYDDTREIVIGHDRDPEHPLRTDPLFAEGAAYWYWTADVEETKLTDCCGRTFYFVTGVAFVRRLTACTNGGVRAVRTPQ